MSTDPRETIAIVGMAALLPGAPDLDAYWRNLVDGVDAITDVPPHRWDEEFYDPDQAHRPDRLYCRRGGFVDDHATFEPLRFGIMPTSIGDIEPDQLITLQVAAAAIDDAGGQDRLPDRDRIGVLLGRGGILSPAQARYAQRVRMSSQVIGILKELIPDLPPESLDRVRRKFDERLGPQQPEGTIGLVPNLAASRVANRLNLRGPSYTIDAACASSLIAVDQGMTELRAGRLDAVLAGGVHHVHDISFWSVFSQLRALSRQGEIRPFDSSADGLLIGEGTGIVVLKRLSDALDAGDRVYAVIRGSGVSSDGRSASMFNPASSGQSLAIRRAWQSAGLDPTDPDAVGLLEAHGTGTPTGDAAELVTVADVFGSYRGGPRPVIGSVKSMIGHTMPAAGIAGLIKATLAVHRGVLPPTLHCGEPRAEMAATRFAPIAAAQPWEGDGPRRAGVNAFGFGGINAHLIIEEPSASVAAWSAGPVPSPAAAPANPTAAGATGPTVAPATVDEPELVLWLAAEQPAGLAALLDRDDAAVRETGLAFARDARAVEAPACRLGVVNPTDKRLATARRAVERGDPWRGARDIWFTSRPLLGPNGGGKLAFVFPGLEAEFTPRTTDLAAHFGLADREWSAADLGRHGAGLIEVGRFLNDVLARIGVRPDLVGGHSIGEWAAAAATGQVSTTDMDGFLKLFDADSVAVSGYVFAAIGAGAEQVTPLLADCPGVVLSHDNAPAQSVVNGPESQVDLLVDELRRRNVLCQKLPFRSAFHTPIFAEGLRSIGAALQSWKVHPTSVPVWSATLAAPFPTDEEQVNEIFVRHMMEPVWFRQTVAAMYAAGTRAYLQVGAGQLASLISDNLRGKDHLAMPVNVGHRTGLDQLRRVATALWVEGAAPDLAALSPRPPVASVAPAAPASNGSNGAKPAGGSATASGSSSGGSSSGGGASSAPRRGPSIRLDLGGPLVRLGPGASELLGLGSRPAAPAAPSPGEPTRPTAPAVPAAPTAQAVPAATAPARPADPVEPADPSPAGNGTTTQNPGALTALHQLAGRSKAAAELAALLRDAADGAVSVLDAATRPGASGAPAAAPPAATPPAAAPAPAPPAAAPAATPPAAAPAATPPAAAPAPAPPTPAPVARPSLPVRTEIARNILRVSVDTMPYLRDHCFFVQPDDWPHAEDRWPVVPATTVVYHMMDAVAQAVPGMRVVGVRDARFNRWTIAAPGQDVEISVKVAGPDQYAVTFGSYARATVEVAAVYPAPVEPPWTHDPATEKPPRISAEEMYSERLMFHGPQFQGVTAVHALGEMHVRGVVTAPVPPGALLDNALQLIGNWLITTQPFRTVALPVGLNRVRFFGPPPAPGTAFECVARVRSIDDTQLVADTQLFIGDRVWAQIDGAVDRRFDSHPQARPAERFPERHPMSLRQPEGWTVVFDAWTDLVTLSMASRGILGTAAFADYERQPAKTRKQWLLGRIAAKDAVRFRQWEAGHTDVYPIELTIANDPNGRPRVDLRPGRGLQECDLSLAHSAEIAVAIAGPARPRPDAPGVGIDVVELVERPESTLRYALSDPELALLDRIATASGTDRQYWFARFWAAKEAAGKAEGTGLDNAPRRLRVTAVDGDTLMVAVAGRTYRVVCREIENPADLPPRRYVVGWTHGPEGH
ncbi:beta-ketoacyl synthase N-terminal-like domain-containing protein [Solwaraspora sp. WMMD406]|uniref:type I polyketide synthase n=1 Tax=Solwaraspora sp. WMMD406 TaxID=3016095 RepID=UPI002415B8CC|nr:type I polyketide synthase [Solwaraspora sp. WMMD406]MDG4765696.1 beta-ketoacyl synthase N-terminal-like domain-containing protein [Solwaraspora sp. WMMD406]